MNEEQILIEYGYLRVIFLEVSKHLQWLRCEAEEDVLVFSFHFWKPENIF